jgi:hypothetical protein
MHIGYFWTFGRAGRVLNVVCRMLDITSVEQVFGNEQSILDAAKHHKGVGPKVLQEVESLLRTEWLQEVTASWDEAVAIRKQKIVSDVLHRQKLSIEDAAMVASLLDDLPQEKFDYLKYRYQD